MRPLAASALALPLLLAVPERAAAQAVFPSAVELVAVDVTVVDRDGRPLTDLQPGDFEIKVGGRRRKLVSAQLVRHTAAAPGAPAAVTPARAETTYASNREQPPGRLIVVVPDVGWMSDAGGRVVVEAAGRFVRGLPPQDKVALLTIPVGPAVDFTTDHSRIAEALKNVRGSRRWRPGISGRRLSLGETMALCSFSGDQAAVSGAVERECGIIGSFGGQNSSSDCVRALKAQAQTECMQIRAVTESSASALLQVLEALRPYEGPKTVVLVSQGLVTGRSAGDVEADQSLYTIADAAARARVSLYTIMADRGFTEAADVTEQSIPQTRSLDESLFKDGLEAIAGYTGGPLLRTMTTADFAFDRVASETSAPWLLSFEPEKDDRDGKGHDIKVAVARGKVEVRARPRFVAAPPAATPETAVQRVRRSLDALLPEADVPVSATTVAFGDASGKIRLVLAAEIGLAKEMAGTAAAGYRLYDADGKVVTGGVTDGALDPVRTAEGDALGIRATVKVDPGTYRLKVSAATPAGRAGGVETTCGAALRGTGRDHGVGPPDHGARPPGRGPGVCVDGRMLGRAARALVEVRGAAAPPTVQIEVASGDSVVWMASARVQPTGEAGVFDADASLDLGPLDAGRYEVRAVVFLADGTESARVSRPLVLPAKP
ncbi:MAG: VWA domain-containing protein [Vicinamibacteria bacterium]